MAASLLTLTVLAQAVSLAATSAAAATAAPETSNAGRAPGTLDGEALVSRWPQVASLVNSAARGLSKVVPADLALPSPAPAQAREAPPQGDGWEARFARGVHGSKAVTEAGADPAGRWVVDKGCSGAGVPALMLQAEELMLAADDAPAAKQREKTAERALRLYHHAKWLAEQNLARAAEWRYREAHRLARQSRRSVLAAHALSRLGYFLMHWRRHDEAREVLRQSELLTKKSNPLAPYLYGVLERRAAGADAERLRLAEDRILSSEEQPSEELETERQQLLRDIRYWQAAEGSPRRCTDSFDAAQVVICLLGHAAFRLR
mmetsp:Transcript_148512/g.458919  ORF Transcript_148512/g.458919 Transcript_148512/m.458919 type:complete len:319 (-) Transcript_148512:95-1051(-)